MQPMGMIAAFRKRMKGVCVHEWIAQYNNYNNTNNNITNNNQNIDNDDDDSSNSPIHKPKEDVTTGTHLCMKLKVIKSTSTTTFVIYNRYFNINTNLNTCIIYLFVCTRIQADKVIENASSATSTLAAAVADATTMNTFNSLSPTHTPTVSQSVSKSASQSVSQISQSNLTDSSQIIQASIDNDTSK